METNKLLTVAVPCYNSEGYMRKCVDTLLGGGSDVEILLINDGSKDGTAAVADEYAQQYPEQVRAIHQENGGHGGAVNTGIENATGLYFKVVDSDDWVNITAFRRILRCLRELRENGKTIDMFISNYVYDKVGVQNKRAMRYRGALPENRILGWSDVGRLKKNQYILMHSVIYRTGLLHECELELPRHTFYVDNLYVYLPLGHVQTLYYLDVDFYHYYIGREGQSVQENVMISRIDQQLRVNKLMVDQIDLEDVPNETQRRYMFNYLGIITLVSSVLLIRAKTPEHILKKEELWAYIRERDARLYRMLRYSMYGILAHAPRDMATVLYKTARKFFGFN